METYWTDKDKDEKKKQLWARTRCGDTREEADIHAGGVKWKKKAEHIKNCEGFGDECARLVDEFKGTNRR